MGPDRHALAQFELGDRLAGPGDDRLLTRDGGQIANGTVDQFRVPGGFADAHVDHNLDQVRNLHDVADGEFLLQRLGDLVAVALLESGQATRLDGRSTHQISSPVARAMRTLRLEVYSEPSGRRLITWVRVSPTLVTTSSPLSFFTTSWTLDA